MNFEELDNSTRDFMLKEFEFEEKNENPFRSKKMTEGGLRIVASLVEESIKHGNEQTLEINLTNSKYWKTYTICHRGNTSYPKEMKLESMAKTFALTEFNTWYVKGMAKKLMSEGIEECEVYRAEAAKIPRCECSKYEGQKVNVKKIYDGHRAKYHPVENLNAFSIPSGPNCHHTIRRINRNKII